MTAVADSNDDGTTAVITSSQVENFIHDTIEPRENWFNRWFPFLKWSPSSPEKLKQAEEELLSYVKTKSEGKYIEVNMDEENNTCRIWTRIYNPDAPQDKLPLIMIHGMGSGMALFAMNLDELSESRTVYTIDLPGYARSSRCKFHSKPEKNEDQFVQAIENWRKTLGIEKMCLLGHSFGGYLSSAYALKYPNHVNHLILADPWGFPEMPKEPRPSRFPWWAKLLYHGIFKHLNPLAGLRLAGPWGQNTIARFRPDLIEKFSPLIENEEDNKRIITGYIFHCNAHNPSGEAAFHNLMQGPAFAKNPMFARLKDLSPDVPLTALYGEQSWITTIPEEKFQEVRKNTGYSKTEIIPEVGHHVYSNPKVFNAEVLDACNYADRKLYQQ